ncbi:MAG: flavin reductase family protein [Bacteroidetes bacterium]|nr:MAG: flavin reductase family protein [Bacteroidota bacterium]
MQIDPSEIAVQKLHHLLLGSIAPRPIAFASTLDKKGKPNLSPFSFFNAFGVNPTTLIFSPSRRGRDNTTKHTYENVKEVPEVVINVVTREIVQQASLASAEYSDGVNEFLKSGLTMLPSVKVRPFRVMESPVQFECKVREVIETGDQGGAGNLVVCEILMMHVDDAILDENGIIDPDKIRLVGRMGGDHYCDAFGPVIFHVEKPLAKPGIGVDQLPDHIRLSKILTGNDLGQLANIKILPDDDAIDRAKELSGDDTEASVHKLAKKLIAEGKVKEALTLLMTLDL